MPRPPRSLPDSLDDSFRIGDAVRAGVTLGRLRALDLERPFRGVRTKRIIEAYAADEDESPLTIDRETRRAVMRRVRAYALVMPPNAFFAGRTAAVAQRLPVEHDPGADLCVAMHSPARGLRGGGIRGIKVSPNLASVRMVEDLRVTSPASTWAMLAGELSQRELVVLGDAIVRVPRDATGRPQPGLRLASIDQLRLAARAPWRRRRALLEAALQQIRVGSMSPLETDFRLGAAAEGLPEPELDVEIREAGGRLLGISDAVYREQRTIVEVEGDHHRTTRAQWNRDIEKYAA
ncbi:hypothetical protein AAIB33_12510 [Microbacterium sp. AZCO]|uniref:hypothetical protein n=1 Tax=Microbacterium sp. AZCO TaxID=3142976 RepID=UPI0031F3C467